jgi:predicted MPP superfamily phosphohydrolase
MDGWSEHEIRNRDLTAPSGIYCGACEIYISTRDGNEKFKAILGKLYGTKPEETECCGCMQTDPLKNKYAYCKICTIRDCIQSRGYYFCHQYSEWPCDRIDNFLLATGDLVDDQLNSMAEAAAQLREIRPRYGKFAVTGNHEFYAGLDDAVEFIRQSGFTLLRQEAATVAGAIDLAGVDDPTIRSAGPRGGLSDREVLSGGSGRFAILLKHQPSVENDAPGAFDLQLSGHTHKGQIFPFSLITRRFFPFHSGNYRLAKDALLHVSRGTGTWGPPIRFLSPPEITVIDLIPG